MPQLIHSAPLLVLIVARGNGNHYISDVALRVFVCWASQHITGISQRLPHGCPLLGLKPCRERSRRPSVSGEMKKHPTVYISALSGTLWPCSPPASKGAAPCFPVALEPPTIVSRLFVLSNLLTLPTRQHPQR